MTSAQLDNDAAADFTAVWMHIRNTGTGSVTIDGFTIVTTGNDLTINPGGKFTVSIAAVGAGNEADILYLAPD